ncbi:M4 family metallopeptidase [Rugosimonospora africana]|uniref:Zinc metalloprotease n=1 Tax=Rugosimonospora africana TaxID=556532 RepID=A0A8J3QVE3_9ACTN|nr:M4 family metallopeptidase [Rugosimonospora africana]GIH17191.1 zinc metalloprotease [Rugosimonospora africana]
MKRYRVLLAAILAASVVTTGGTTHAATAAPGPAAPGPATPPAQPSALASRSAGVLMDSRPSYLQASPLDQFVAQPVISAGDLQYVSYNRTYAGLPVIGGNVVIATDSTGKVLAHSVSQKRPIGVLDTTPTVTSAAAVEVAKAQLRDVTGVGPARLVVYGAGTTPRLAWESTVDGTGAHGPSRLTVDVDAGNGKVLDAREGIMDGTGNSGWNGPNPLSIGTTQSGGTFSMQDPSIPNLRCQDNVSGLTFTGTDDNWGNGDPKNLETACVDALFATRTETQMVGQWLGRNGLDGRGGAWPMNVGWDAVNAEYMGNDVGVRIGHNTSGQSIASLDVVGHENGHGVDFNTPNGLSNVSTFEFVADAFGTATEWFANEPAPFDTPDFTIGERVNLNGTGPIRFMYNPSLVGHPNCYSPDVLTMDQHAAGGVGDHWFYLLAEGTSPTNGQPASPTCNGSGIGGLGIQVATKILYNAMLMKPLNAMYTDYRIWTLQAAKNLFITTCAPFNTVKAAWDAVSVPAQPGEPTCTDVHSNAPDQTVTQGSSVNLNLASFVSGGTAPYHWFPSLIFLLPPGLSLNPNTGAVTGSPTTPGTYTFSFSVAESGGRQTDDSMIWVVNTPTVAVPSIVNVGVGTAQSRLSAVGLFLGSETDRNTTNCDLTDKVSGQNPAAGQVVPRGSFVNYSVWVLAPGHQCQ